MMPFDTLVFIVYLGESIVKLACVWLGSGRKRLYFTQALAKLSPGYPPSELSPSLPLLGFSVLLALLGSEAKNPGSESTTAKGQGKGNWGLEPASRGGEEILLRERILIPDAFCPALGVPKDCSPFSIITIATSISQLLHCSRAKQMAHSISFNSHDIAAKVLILSPLDPLEK